LIKTGISWFVDQSNAVKTTRN